VTGVLHVETDGAGPRAVLVHGFTQNRNCWGPLAPALTTDHQVVRIDAPGHGKSSSIEADLWRGAELLASGGGHATYLGYSMGARFALHVALAHPEVVRGLVLIGGTAGIDDPDARAARKRADEETATQLEHQGLEPFLEAWLAQPLFAGLPDAMQFRSERTNNTVEGLASSLRLAGTGSQDPLQSRLAAIDVPVLVMAGADDTKFSAEAERLTSSVGANATIALVPSAGHAAHLEQPDACTAIIREWLDAHDL
jgi:2-succinyl-6-hydroxy-2,4-cyclohexadiene-1-carboxylate synthase